MNCKICDLYNLDETIAKKIVRKNIHILGKYCPI